MTEPPSLNARRAVESDDCMAWNPREMLVWLLQELDAGRFKPTAIALCYFALEKDHLMVTGMRRSRCTVMEAVAMVEIAKHDLLSP